MATPVYLITGFLGSGKTTLLNKLLCEIPKGRKIAVIVNEIGSISIDRKLIPHGNYDVIELTSGCICCTLRSDIIKTLLKIIDEYKPEAIVIEATGIAIPKDIAADINQDKYSSKMFTASVIGLVNCAKYLEMSKKLFIINAQLKEVSAVVLNKIDVVNNEELEKIYGKVKSIAVKNIPVYESEFGEVAFEKLFPALFHDIPHLAKHHICNCACLHHHEHDSDELLQHAHEHKHFHSSSTDSISSRVFITDKTVSHKMLAEFFTKNGERLLRAKGIVCTDYGFKVFQFAPDGLRVENYKNIHSQSEMVIIALNKHIQSLAEECENIFC